MRILTTMRPRSTVTPASSQDLNVRNPWGQTCKLCAILPILFHSGAVVAHSALKSASSGACENRAMTALAALPRTGPNACLYWCRLGGWWVDHECERRYSCWWLWNSGCELVPGGSGRLRDVLGSRRLGSGWRLSEVRGMASHLVKRMVESGDEDSSAYSCRPITACRIRKEISTCG